MEYNFQIFYEFSFSQKRISVLRKRIFPLDFCFDENGKSWRKVFPIEGLSLSENSRSWLTFFSLIKLTYI